MKILFELLLSIFLHPIAMVLSWLSLAARDDLNTTQKIIWAIVVFLWGIGPILYLVFGNGELW